MAATRAALAGSALVHGLALALALLLPSPQGKEAGRAARVDLVAVVLAPPRLLDPEPVRRTAGLPRTRPGPAARLIAEPAIAEPTIAAPAMVQQSLQPMPAAPGVLVPPATPSVPSVPPVPAPVAVPAASLRSAYAARLWSHVAAHRPTGFGLSGEAQVTFTLDRTGRVIAAVISRSSGQVLLDKAALRAVRQSSPCPPPPESLEDTALTFVVAVRFGAMG